MMESSVLVQDRVNLEALDIHDGSKFPRLLYIGIMTRSSFCIYNCK